jgi:hypothetical protein
MRLGSALLTVGCVALVLGCSSTARSADERATPRSTSSPPIASPDQVTGAAESRSPRCHDARLAVKLVEGVSSMTGEHAFFVQFMLTSTTACHLRGYPTASFMTRSGQAVPFRLVAGNGPYVTHRRPPRLDLIGAGDSFFVEVAKYRCDLRTLKTATKAAFRLPGVNRAIVVHFGHITKFDYCDEPQSQTIYISPAVENESQFGRDDS